MANEIHGQKYDYSQTDYKKSVIKILIGCSIHGMFEQTPHIHLGGHGCPKCFGGIKYNREYFIEKATIKHNNIYDYSLVKYCGWNKKVDIICTKHGMFKQAPNAHLMGHGCNECYLMTKRTENEDFAKKCSIIHNNKYDYSKTTFKNLNEKVTIICPEHGKFLQLVESHLNGHGCRACANNMIKLNKDQFIERSNAIHNNLFSYELVEYINNYTSVKIMCQKHGVFQQTPKNHMLGVGCPFCREEQKNIMTPLSNYSRIVDNITNKYKNELFYRWNGYDFYDGEPIAKNFLLTPNSKSYPTIDHKISKHSGFINNISPEIIGNINNLCITKRTINSIKNRTNFNEFQIKQKI